MLKIVTAIEENYSIETQSINKKVFLAGGIMGCPNWQNDFLNICREHTEYSMNMTIFNPRRDNFPEDDINSHVEQICWEHKHLKESDIIVFWFSRGTVNPITLYELGRWGNSQLNNKKIIIGIDPEYIKRDTVITQSKLDNPNIEICDSLISLSKKLFKEINN